MIMFIKSQNLLNELFKCLAFQLEFEWLGTVANSCISPWIVAKSSAGAGFIVPRLRIHLQLLFITSYKLLKFESFF